jgi:hypothetical protein
VSEFQYKLFLARMGVGGPAGLGALLAWLEIFGNRYDRSLR